MTNNKTSATNNIKWYRLLKYQIPIAVLVLFSLLSSAIVFTLSSVNARKHDYAILNLAGQLRVISTSIITQSTQYKANAPRDYASYNRDLKTYANNLNSQLKSYEEIITAFSDRKFSEALTGLDSELTCNWDDRSISQLDLTVFEWQNFKAGLDKSLGNNKDEPRLEAAAEYIIQKSSLLSNATDSLSKEFRLMMQRKLDTLVLTIKGLLLLSALTAGGILSLLYFQLLRPLKGSLTGISHISNGDLKYRIETSTNEISILNTEINRMASSLNAIFNLTSHISQAKTIDETLQIVFNEFNEISPIDWTGIFRVNVNRSQIKLDSIFSDFDSKLKENQSFEFSGSLMEEMIDKDEIRIINDISKIEKEFPKSEIVQLFHKDKLQSALLLPLTTSFKDDNVIIFASKQVNAYDKSKNGLLHFIGNQLTHSFEKNVVMENLVISAVEGLAKLAESRDPETGDHLLRMSIYSSIIAQQLKNNSSYGYQINNQYIRDILRFSPMHDIGKVGIEDNILLKTAQLTAEEWEVMKQHPVIGGDVLRRCEFQMNQVGHTIFKLGIEIADSHHEKFNGKGYPNSLSGTNIPLSARIVAVADVFDALTSKRPYKDAWPVDKALNLLKDEAGNHFDPVVVQAFMDALDEIMKVYDKHKHV